MWKVSRKFLLITPCIIVFIVYIKPFLVPEPVKSTESRVNLKLRQFKAKDLLPKKTKTVEILPKMPSALVPACPNVLTNMMQGNWKQHSMTPAQRQEIDYFLNFLVHVKAAPLSLQRTDLQCGNVTYASPYNKIKWLRALCGVNGDTPCCYNNKCVSKTTEECKCDNCFDLRTRIIAEYAEWIPFDRRCAVKVYNQNDACELLSDHVIVFIGDSMVRHVYIALLLLLQNNYVDGALRRGTPKDIRKECLKTEILTDKTCRRYIDRNITVCGGRVKLIMEEFKGSRYLNETGQLLNQISESTKKSLVFLGIGVHDNHNSTTVIHSYLKPLKKLHSSFHHSNINLLWATPSNYGLFKAHRYPQRKVDVLRFMNDTGKFLKSANIPQFNTYDITRDVRSQDGHHYGLGLNKWKVFILLNYIQELKTKGQW